jgi:hypothetical protein
MSWSHKINQNQKKRKDKMNVDFDREMMVHQGEAIGSPGWQ